MVLFCSSPLTATKTNPPTGMTEDSWFNIDFLMGTAVLILG